MTLSFGGGAGVLTIPGLTGDGHTPGGIVVAGTITAGKSNATAPQYHLIYGNVDIVGLNADLQDGDPVLVAEQHGVLTSDQGASALLIRRAVTHNGHAMFGALLQFDYAGSDSVPDAEPVIDHPRFQLNAAGGFGRFGHTPVPTVPSSITGALSAVTDPAALDVLTAIIAALTADGGATNNTT